MKNKCYICEDYGGDDVGLGAGRGLSVQNITTVKNIAKKYDQFS